MTRNGIAFQRQPLAPVTDAIAFLLSLTDEPIWPTPDAGAFNLNDTPENFERRRQTMIAKGYNANGAGTPLAMAVKIWPTPTVGDSKSAARHTTTTGVSHAGTSLTDAVRIWPTPTVRDGKDGTTRYGPSGSAPVNSLLGRAVNPSPESGALNPTWVEWLQGFPLNWTLVP
jgi:DNA (cytosine-5)-methyltransferase 1